MCDRQVFVILDHFLPFTPLIIWKIKILKKWKKTLGDIIILHKCTKNHDHMLYCSWDMVCDRCNYFSFWAIFCPFIHLTARKIKIWKKWKRSLEISSFYTSVPKIMIIRYTVSEIWCVTDIIVSFHFGLFFPFIAQKIKILQKWKKKTKNPGDIIILHMCNKNHDQIMYSSWDRTDGHTDQKTDRWKKWHIERWVSHLITNQLRKWCKP